MSYSFTRQYVCNNFLSVRCIVKKRVSSDVTEMTVRTSLRGTKPLSFFFIQRGNLNSTLYQKLWCRYQTWKVKIWVCKSTLVIRFSYWCHAPSFRSSSKIGGLCDTKFVGEESSPLHPSLRLGWTHRPGTRCKGILLKGKFLRNHKKRRVTRVNSGRIDFTVSTGLF